MIRLLVAAICCVLLLPTVANAQMDPLTTNLIAATYLLEDNDYSCTAEAIKVTDAGTYLLTARHCAIDEDSQKPVTDLWVEQSDAQKYPVKLVGAGTDALHDWAVMVAPTLKAPFVDTLGFGDDVYPGVPVEMVGYPLGIGPNVTLGHVTSPLLTFQGQRFFAMDAFGLPGNSGSAVVDQMTGNVIGIMVATISDNDMGIGGIEMCTPLSLVVLPQMP